MYEFRVHLFVYLFLDWRMPIVFPVWLIAFKLIVVGYAVKKYANFERNQCMRYWPTTHMVNENTFHLNLLWNLNESSSVDSSRLIKSADSLKLTSDWTAWECVRCPLNQFFFSPSSTSASWFHSTEYISVLYFWYTIYLVILSMLWLSFMF